MFTGLLDEIAGSVTPKQLPGERVTATQVNVFSEREEERRDERADAVCAGPARGVEGLMCCPDVSTFEATEARFACKVAMGLVKWTSSAPHEAQEESDQ